MKKDAIIDIIANDLKEIELLLENFKGDDYIQAQFIELLQTKHANLAKEIELLNFWKKEETTTKTEEAIPLAPEATNDKQTIAEPDPIPAEPVIKTIEEPAPIAAEPATIAAEPATPIVAAEPKIIEHEHIEETPVVAKAPVETQEVKARPATYSNALRQTAKASDLTNYGTPVSDIRRAIAIADRFLYQKELFNGDNEQMNLTIDAINSMANYDDAELYLFNKYGWDPENATTIAFMKAVHRRFL